MNFSIERLREVVNSTTRSDWYRVAHGVDNSQARIFEYKGKVPVGDYFLCDCIGNTVDLCKKTERKYRNADGRLVACMVIETLIPDCTDKFGGPINGVWSIPIHLL